LFFAFLGLQLLQAVGTDIMRCIFDLNRTAVGGTNVSVAEIAFCSGRFIVHRRKLRLLEGDSSGLKFGQCDDLANGANAGNVFDPGHNFVAANSIGLTFGKVFGPPIFVNLNDFPGTKLDQGSGQIVDVRLHFAMFRVGSQAGKKVIRILIRLGNVRLIWLVNLFQGKPLQGSSDSRNDTSGLWIVVVCVHTDYS